MTVSDANMLHEKRNKQFTSTCTMTGSSIKHDFHFDGSMQDVNARSTLCKVTYKYKMHINPFRSLNVEKQYFGYIDSLTFSMYFTLRDKI